MTGTGSALQGRRILVVEDDYFVALVLVTLLEDFGAEVVGPIGWVEEALTLINDSDQPFDSAVLDINLHGHKSYPIADALTARAVPFVFVTGYGDGALENQYRSFPRCEKPFNHNTLIAALAGR